MEELPVLLLVLLLLLLVELLLSVLGQGQLLVERLLLQEAVAIREGLLLLLQDRAQLL